MMSSARRQRRFFRRGSLVLVLLVLALSALTTAVALAVTRHAPPQLRTARGVVDGSFHPIAGKFVPDKTQLRDCRAGDVRCFEQAFGNLAYQEGPKPALALFDQRRAADKTVSSDCHRIAHMIGSAALAYFHGNVAQAYSHGSASCASGYFHGILERAFAKVHSEAGLIRVARSLCRGAGVRRHSFLDYQCTHGLGHGLMIQTGYDLPTALRVCGRLQTRWDEISCTGGAFMENGSTVYGLRSQWLKDNDPIYPCNRVKLRDKSSCYLRVTTQILRTNRFNWPATAARCREVGAKWRLYCFRSYGRDTVQYASGKSRSILRLCELAGPEAGQCLYGAARTLSDRDASAKQAAAFCRTAPTGQAASCFAGLGVVVGLLQPTDHDQAKACAHPAGAYAGACLGAAIGEVAPNGRGAWG
ncbi:MAG: hypothetical protein E6G36_09270 [Actinobacteria bacterium]|nr:MAG: hypothetical protein E6G36_09270 [Actinomycetota bacterium]